MNPSLFWFSDEQWAKIKPHLPTNQPGPERVHALAKQDRVDCCPLGLARNGVRGNLERPGRRGPWTRSGLAGP